ncbi:hypothetical protein [Carboxylicivirga caseinilyticus]|uniref:hypothetical protein n=1 Tax=Carboxylicivirga caseinilyticus TaxID=3417572 RepID=UPI003D326235|nr:hypothetical protein [Marinilabiliaceae bacterium A049]
MKAKTDYILFPECKLVVELYQGSIYVDDILQLKLRSAQDKNYQPDFSVIMDFRPATIVGGSIEVNEYVTKLKQLPTILGERYVSVLTSKPNEVVVATLFELFNRELPIVSKIFSTQDAAINWLSNVNSGIINCYKNLDKLQEILTKQAHLATE